MSRSSHVWKLSLVAALALTVAQPVPALPADDPLAGAVPPVVAYPDLVPDVTEIGVFRPTMWDDATATSFEGPPNLYFDTQSQNLGSVPVELTADDPQDVTGSTVSQCIAWTLDRVCREQRRVGGFTWHDEHKHFHYEDFAEYELRRLRPNGSVDYSERGLVAISEKVSFCLMDSEKVRDDALPAPVYAACNHVRQGISPGWKDIYTSGLAGQQFVLPGVADGRYGLVITMDTADSLFESDNSNNRLVVIIELSNEGRAVQVLGKQWPALRG